MPSRPDPAEELRAHLRGERHTTGPHPSPEHLAAYQEKRLSPAEAEEVRAHLAACPACTAQLLELMALFDEDDLEEDDPGAEVSRVDLDAAWERQRARLPLPLPAPLAPRSTAAPLRRAWATAASLGLAAALLAVVSLIQWQTIAQLRQPQVNPPLVDLAPVGSVRQGSAVTELRLSAGTERVWVILNPVTELDAPAYEVEVTAPDGATVLRLGDLQSSEAGNFRLEIPRGVLTEGDYRFVLFGRKDRRREVVGEFALRVRPALPAP